VIGLGGGGQFKAELGRKDFSRARYVTQSGVGWELELSEVDRGVQRGVSG